MSFIAALGSFEISLANNANVEDGSRMILPWKTCAPYRDNSIGILFSEGLGEFMFEKNSILQAASFQ